MKDVMGIINLNEREEGLPGLTDHRPVAAVPFGGRYRLIDFVLSNMVNSGIYNVGVLVQHKYRSLVDHLRAAREWDLARKKDGLVILPPAYTQSPGESFRGDLANFYHHRDYFQKSSQAYVVISGANTVCNLNYADALAFHRGTKADITVLYREEDSPKGDCLVLHTRSDGRITGMGTPETTGRQKVSLAMFIIGKALLVDLVETCFSRGDVDFVRDCIGKHLDRLNVYAYPHLGYLARIDSIASFFKHNMDLLKPAIWKELFFQSGQIYTKGKDEAPARYMQSACVKNALVAGGCLIAGTVENSILFRGVTVHKGACVQDSILMQGAEIAANAFVHNVICDKDVRITAGKQLVGDVNNPLVIKKGSVIT